MEEQISDTITEGLTISNEEALLFFKETPLSI